MEVVVHVGLHKTATTYLQTKVFPQLRGIHYIDGNAPELSSWKRWVCSEDLDSFDPDAARKELMGYFEAGSNLLSSEALSGNAFLQYRNREAILQKLKAMFPDARVIVGIRAQRDILWSKYRQYILKGGTQSFEMVLHPDGTADQLGADLTTYRYSGYLDRVSELFGPENLHVLLYEDLIIDPETQLADLLRFLRAEVSGEVRNSDRVNAGISDEFVATLRSINRGFAALGLRRRSFRRWRVRLGRVVDRGLALFPRRPIQGDDQASAALIDFYRDDNRFIDEKYHLRIAEREYTRLRYLGGE